MRNLLNWKGKGYAQGSLRSLTGKTARISFLFQCPIRMSRRPGDERSVFSGGMNYDRRQ